MPENSQLVAVVETTVMVERSLFLLQNVNSPDHPGASLPSLDPLVSVDSGGAVFISGAPAHYAAARLELWNREPPATDVTSWDQTKRVTIDCDERGFQIGEAMGRPTGDILRTPQTGTYTLDVAVRGHNDVAAASETSPDPYSIVGLEQWRLRISYLHPFHHEPRITLTQLIQTCAVEETMRRQSLRQSAKGRFSTRSDFSDLGTSIDIGPDGTILPRSVSCVPLLLN